MKIKLVLFIIMIVIIIYYCYNQIYEPFSNDEPFKINFDNMNPIILQEGTYVHNTRRKEGDLSLPISIIINLNNITSFEIDSNYYAMIAVNNSEPRIYRGSYIIQNYNLFKYVTKIQIYKNTDDFK